MKVENLHALSRKAKLCELPSGRLLFKEGDIDRRTLYLVSGAIELLQRKHKHPSIAAGPSSITVPAGATSAQFTVFTSRPKSPTQVTISANLANVTKAATLTVKR